MPASADVLEFTSILHLRGTDRPITFDGGLEYVRLVDAPPLSAARAADLVRYLEEEHVGITWGNEAFMAVFDGDRVVGLSSGGSDDGPGDWELSVSVSASHRRRGISILLAAAASHYCGENGLILWGEAETEAGAAFHLYLSNHSNGYFAQDFVWGVELCPGSLCDGLHGAAFDATILVA